MYMYYVITCLHMYMYVYECNNGLRTGRLEHDTSVHSLWGKSSITGSCSSNFHFQSYMLHYQMLNGCIFQQLAKQWNFDQNFDMEPHSTAGPQSTNHDHVKVLLCDIKHFKALDL